MRTTGTVPTPEQNRRHVVADGGAPRTATYHARGFEGNEPTLAQAPTRQPAQPGRATDLSQVGDGERCYRIQLRMASFTNGESLLCDAASGLST